MKYKCQVFRSTPLMLVVVCLSITSFPDTALIGNSKEPMQISVDSFQQAAFVPSGHGVVSWNESSRVRHRIISPSKLQIRGKDGAPFLFSLVPDGEKSAIDRMRRTASENGESSESFTFASLSLSFHDELSRLANIIKDFDSADSTKRERAAQLIYGLSNKKEYSDLIIPSLINQLEHPEKYESTLDTATASLLYYGVMPEKYSKRAILAAIDTLSHRNVVISDRSGRFLEQQGKAALPFVLAAFPAKGSDQRKTRLLQFLSITGPDASAAMPLLLADLKERPFAAGAICTAILEIDPENEIAAIAFLKRLQSEKSPEYEKKVVARSLARNSRYGKEAIRYLAKNLAAQDRVQLTFDLMAIWHVRDLSEAKPQIEKVFNETKDEYLRILSAGMLVRINSRNLAARKVLSENAEDLSSLLDDSHWEVRIFGIWVMKELGQKQALIKLERIATEDSHKTVRDHATAAIKAIQK